MSTVFGELDWSPDFKRYFLRKATLNPTAPREAVIVSLTHLRLRRSLPFAAAVQSYQKHRTKKLKKQNGRR